jgi:hypothetical protein
MLNFFVLGVGMQTKRVMTSRATFVAGSLAYVGVLAVWLFRGAGAACVEVLRQTNSMPNVRLSHFFLACQTSRVSQGLLPLFWLVRPNNDVKMVRDNTKEGCGERCLCVRFVHKRSHQREKNRNGGLLCSACLGTWDGSNPW